MDMHGPAPTKERRHEVRPGLKVVHRHRIGAAVVERTSELLYVNRRPVALLDWINLGGIRTPLYKCQLDEGKLHPAKERGVFHYDGMTSDPRYPESDPSAVEMH
jgi:hypothetical protein